MSYSISDTADNIQAETSGDGTSVGVLGGAPVEATDESADHCGRRKRAVRSHYGPGGYAVDDSHFDQSAFDDGLEEFDRRGLGEGGRDCGVDRRRVQAPRGRG